VRLDVNLDAWAHVAKGHYRGHCGRGHVYKIGPKDWGAAVDGRPVGDGHTAAEATYLAQRAIIQWTLSSTDVIDAIKGLRDRRDRHARQPHGLAREQGPGGALKTTVTPGPSGPC